jgi:hypothetical protein
VSSPLASLRHADIIGLRAGRADDQLRRNHSTQYRNHSTQYLAHPDHPWYRLRDEAPGVYESYVDLVPGEWTSLRIVVADGQARLHVHDADQPGLVVDALLLGERRGSVAVWIGRGPRRTSRR